MEAAVGKWEQPWENGSNPGNMGATLGTTLAVNKEKGWVKERRNKMQLWKISRDHGKKHG